MKDDRGVLLVATARGMEPIDRQRFKAGFLAQWYETRQLGDGLRHAISPTYEKLGSGSTVHERNGWATFCVSGLSHERPPGMRRPRHPVTCVACLAGLFR